MLICYNLGMEKIIIASDNAHKIKEFAEMFGDGYEIISLKDAGFIGEIEENGHSFHENSLIKAKAVSEFLQKKGVFAPVLADDSGLCVEALGGEPGIYSARYAGFHGSDAANRKKLLDNMENISDRRAYFCCVITEYFPDGSYIFGEGRTYGVITREEIGDKGFGYDCLFLSDDLGETFGTAPADKKNAVSHRGRALKALLEKL